MASTEPVYYLVRENRFWELTISGRKTTPRYGKIGCAGRRLAPTVHSSAEKAKQFARRLINTKIIEGFTKLDRKSATQELSKNIPERTLSLRQQPTLVPKPGNNCPGKESDKSWRKPAKKRSSVRLRYSSGQSFQSLAKQRTLSKNQESSTGDKATSSQQSESARWRRPPKKQSTIRRMAKQQSLAQQREQKRKVIDNKKGSEKPSLSRKSSLRRSAVARAALSVDVPMGSPASEKKMRGVQVSPQDVAVLSKIRLKCNKALKEPESMDMQGAGTSSSHAPQDPDIPILSRQATLPPPNIPFESYSSKAKTVPRPLMTRLPSLTVGTEGLYVPSRKDWPVRIQSPLLWQCKTAGKDAFAYGLFVDDTQCVFGDDKGFVVELNAAGTVSNVYKLNAAVKCIKKEQELLFIGCNDGGVYDISTTQPRIIYRAIYKDKPIVEVQGLDICDGFLGASNSQGFFALLNHECQVVWTQQGAGVGGWMLSMDTTAVYHGHSGGLSKYNMADGSVMWQLTDIGTIFYGVQEGRYIYAADSSSVRKIDKLRGRVIKIYGKENEGGSIDCNAVGGGMVFAGGNPIRCYDEHTGAMVYLLDHPFRPLSMKYHSGRLYLVGEGGLSVIDLSKEAVIASKRGYPSKPHVINIDAPKPMPPLARVESISKREAAGGVHVKCVKEEGRLKIKPLSSGFKKHLSCLFPLDLEQEGTKYIVDGLNLSNNGRYYKVLGNIREIDES